MLKMDEELIIKYLDGEASPDEAMAVDDWRNASFENKQLFEQIEQSASLFGRGRKFESPEVSQEWQKLKAVTFDKPAGKTRSLFTPLRIAASLLLISVVGAVVYMTLDSDTSTKTKQLTKESTGEILSTDLADQSRITQYRNTVISYPAKFDKKTREVELVKGEAYFDVTHNPEMPFVVTVHELQVKVLGTSFDIRNEEESNAIEIQVTKGTVLIYNSYGSEVVKAGQTGTYYRDTKSFEVTGTNASSVNTVSYATQSFDFRDVTLENVTNDLSKTFGVTFQFKNDKLKNCRLNGEFKNRSLDFILKVISATFEIEYTKENNTISLSGNACD